MVTSATCFSEVEGSTIEKYLIAQKIEKVKELMMYDELTLSQIANQLGYSSVAYLSSQFKKQTGLTPTFYRALKREQTPQYRRPVNVINQSRNYVTFAFCPVHLCYKI
jgi:AraC-like DNA-binding protein